MEDRYYFCSIGHPTSNIPMLTLALIVVSEGESEVQVAKKLRKQVAEHAENYGYEQGTKFAPAELYWALYRKGEYDMPINHSDNAPEILFMTDAKQLALLAEENKSR